MNVIDLTTELQAHASEAAPTASMNRLTGVRQKIRVRRRRQAAAAGLAAVCVVATVFLAPSISSLRANRTPPPATTDTEPKPSDPLSFAPDVTGDSLIAQSVGQPGARELVLRFTPADLDLALSVFCRLPGATVPDQGHSTSMADTTINGHPLTGSDCSGGNGANQSTMTFDNDDPTANRAGWAALGVLPGRESVLRMVVQTSKGTSAVTPMIRLGAGVYVLSGERVISDGVRIKVLGQADGHQYRLAGHRTAPATATQRRLELEVPTGAHPVMLLWGVAAKAATGTDRTAHLLVDGEEESSSTGGGIGSGDLLDDAGAHTIELRLDPGLRGTMVIAYYVRVD